MSDDIRKLDEKIDGIERTLLVVAQSMSAVIKHVRLLQEEQTQLRAVLEKRHDAYYQDNLRMMTRMSHLMTDIETLADVVNDIDETLAAIIRASGGGKQEDKAPVKSTRVG